jgi:hypothetical protein
MKILRSNQLTDANTIIGDKIKSSGVLDLDGWPINDTNHETVLRSSSQCLPMIRYDKALIEEGEAGLKYMRWMVVELESIVDKLFNNGDAGIKLALPPLLGHAETSSPPSDEKQKAASLGTPATKSGRTSSGGQQLSNSANVATAVAQIKSPLFGFGCNSNSSTDHRGQDFEKILTAFYQKHNPSKVAEVNSIL